MSTEEWTSINLHKELRDELRELKGTKTYNGIVRDALDAYYEESSD